MILVSACLLGINCQYNCESDLTEKLLEFLKDKGEFIAICPEVLGGLPIPRDASAIVNGGEKDIDLKKVKVRSIKNKDVSNEFVKGAQRVLEIAKQNKVHLAILKAKSPSCGAGLIYDDTFTRNLIAGDGITAAMLKKHGVKVMTEKDLINNKWPK